MYKLCLVLITAIGLGNYSVAQTSLGTSKSLLGELKKDLSSKSTSRGVGSSVDLDIPGSSLNGKVNYKQSEAGSEFLMGEVDGVSGSSFFIKAGENSLDGHIILKDTKKAYKYYSDASGNAFVEEVDINSLICIDYENKPSKKQKTEAQAREAAAISPALLDLQSLPGAAGVVLLDFDGYYMPAGNYWNNGNAINAAPSGLSDDAVYEHWEVVAEDYRPFNLNITTNEAVYNSYPRNRRMRVVITPTNTAAPGAGGVAYFGSFNWDNDVPCWVFILSGKSGGDASSHEIGHTFDLQHDGRSNPDEGYFLGIDGTAWAPIMGAGYYRPVVQWSKGEYRYAKNDQPGQLQDDIATIAGSKFGIGFRGDDYSNSTANAANLDYNGNGDINQKNGVISSEGDYDFFSFTTGGGRVQINASTISRNGNLHLLIRLYDASGNLLSTHWNSDPFALNANMDVNLGAGKYFIGVDGNGAGDPAYGGYSAYGSIGSYWVTGNIPPGGGVNPSTGLVTTYKDVNYTGFSGGFSVGDYNLAALRNLGVEDNSITSVKVSEGYKIILYFDDNFTGQSVEITADNGYVGNFNDQVTSLRVRPNGDQNLAGTYYLKNGMSGLFMDVWGAGTSDGDAIRQGGFNGNLNQQFDLIHKGDGLYQIAAKHSGKSMDVAGISKAEGALIHQWTYGGPQNQNQNFILFKASNGLYKLIAEHSGKVVEVSTSDNGEQLHQWWNANQANSTWQLVAIPKPTTGLVTTYKDLNYTGFSGGFSVGDYNLAALKALGVEDNSITSVKVTEGYKIILYFDDNFTGQSMTITSDNGFVGNFNDQVTSLRVRANGDPNISGNTFHLQNRNSGLYLDVLNANTADGGNVVQGGPNGLPNEDFKLIHIGDGAYQIQAVHSGKVVTVDGAGTADGTNVVQWSYAGFYNQQLIAFPTGDGYYKLIATHSGKLIEVAGFSTANGGNVQQWANVNQTSGQWKLVPVVVAPPVDGTGDGLIGNYFNGMNFETPVYNRKDATINFAWGDGSPNAAVDADRFSVRWSGQVQPQYSGEYTFFVNSDNGRRLWINGQLIIDAWIDNWDVDYSGKIILTANQKYDIKLEYFENYGGAGAKLEWSHASQQRQVIPSKQLYSNPVTPVNQLPSVALTSPANNASYDAPASVSIAANASDADGSIAKVQFFNGNQLLGEDANSPYTFNWTNVGAGTYTITAKAIDNTGASATSAGVSVTVRSVVTDQCSSVAQYVENGGYVAGSNVKNAGAKFECKEWPYSGWCNGASWAYAPGTGAYWTDAWYDRGSCTPTTGGSSLSTAESLLISPNPVQGELNISSSYSLSGASIMIVDVTGKTLYNSEAVEWISTSDLDAGIYTLILITSDNQKMTKRFVKIK